jgi:hypothetical protein
MLYKVVSSKPYPQFVDLASHLSTLGVISKLEVLDNTNAVVQYSKLEPNYGSYDENKNGHMAIMATGDKVSLTCKSHCYELLQLNINTIKTACELTYDNQHGVYVDKKTLLCYSLNDITSKPVGEIKIVDQGIEFVKRIN